MFVYAHPADGCQPISPPNITDFKLYMWVVLVSRNKCTFEKKVRNAQEAMYDAVIIHNVNSNALEPMSAANSTGIYIPSVFIGEADGLYLKQLSFSSDYYIVITPDVPFNINTHLLLPFAIVVGICFFVMILFMVSWSFVMFCCCWRHFLGWICSDLNNFVD